MKPSEPIPMSEPDMAQWETEYEAWCREQDEADAINAMLTGAEIEDF